MQERMLDGSYGNPVPYDESEMKRMLADPGVNHVDVFNATPDEMHRRKQLFEQSQSKKRKSRKQKNRIQSKSRKSNK